MNEYFDKIYVLSLKRNIDRRNLISERLKIVGIEFEFFDACDGQVLDNIWVKFDNPFFTTRNYLACAISHLSIYNDALSRGFNKILILEDDVKPHKNIQNLFKSWETQIPTDYELLYFGWIPLNDDCSMWTYNIIDDKFLNNNLIKSHNLWGLYAYSPSRHLMSEMIDIYNKSFPMEIDRYFVEFIQRERKSFAVWPQLICHDILPSNNHGYTDNQSLLKSIDHRGFTSEDFV